jgi:hypothetical protein
MEGLRKLYAVSGLTLEHRDIPNANTTSSHFMRRFIAQSNDFRGLIVRRLKQSRHDVNHPLHLMSELTMNIAVPPYQIHPAGKVIR